MDKSALRKSILARIRAFPGKEMESSLISSYLLESGMLARHDTILAFCPLDSEPDITPILKGRSVMLPYIENGRMGFSYYQGLVKSELGFMEPDERIEGEYSSALMLVPLVAFDKELNRLGRGKGFYDAYINENRERLCTVGIAFSVSQVPAVPVEDNDMRLDSILTVHDGKAMLLNCRKQGY
ncbi:MAG: 5-formyltetrahydrofolate cyclo-ligase [Candidatus Ornithospirochaeta sp.]|nr:5-formyltetrahydrofolate cyclo-ligase [Candidatus Ornithospirochaeta sp.]